MKTGFGFSWIKSKLNHRLDFGLQMLLGALLNVSGLGIRFISTISQVKDYSFTVVMVGQGIAATAQPFLLFAPTKLAAVWFPDSQRAIANTLGSASNPLGILMAFLFSKMIVQSTEDIPRMVCVTIESLVNNNQSFNQSFTKLHVLVSWSSQYNKVLRTWTSKSLLGPYSTETTRSLWGPYSTETTRSL